jgi:hypothetical protein
MRRRLLRKRCGHTHVRCIHGDEINRYDGARVLCVDCGRTLPIPLPDYCNVTGKSHYSAEMEGR